MYSEYVKEAAKRLAETMNNADVALYGSQFRLPNRGEVIGLLKDIRSLFFPAYFGNPELMSIGSEEYSALMLNRIEKTMTTQIAQALPEEESCRAEELTHEIISALPDVQRILLTDLDALYEGDPAAQNKGEIIFSYPGLFAIFSFRVAHEFYIRNIPMIPRMMTEYAHSRTGIDINPGATIGEYFFIDHGTGIVIGETSDIGKHVKLYQGVTLGALSPRAGHSSIPGKRHPTVMDGATIYSGASILGGDTVIGQNSVVGSNAFLTNSVDNDTRAVVHAPETIYKSK